MGEPFIGEIRMFAGNFAPAGWAFCQGQLIPISQNDTLFNLIGTMYGGDGQETFGLPNLSGRAPMHFGQGPGISQSYQQGEMAGVEQVTLSTSQIPVHNHAFVASTDTALNTSPTNNILAAGITTKLFTQDVTNGSMNPQSVSAVGGNQPHENMQPFLVISFILSLYGVFPQQN